MDAATDTHKYTNRLIHETSPYLLQHAHNPVDWHPWGHEALDLARREDKPVFLSIGYSTCHWCHVMAHESFEDERIAGILNENFICIKLDREQRPDVDAVYMQAVHMLTGSGGWPLSIFLAPDGKPFYGGTYFPPTDGLGRPGFDKILLAIADAWRNRRDELLDSAQRVHALMQQHTEITEGSAINPGTLDSAYALLSRIYDTGYGGFGTAPKFPQPGNLSFLLRYYHRTADPNALHMVTATLDNMARGGMYDHLAGGFHRYSTDARWLVPHFEKMLYDQALLSGVYLDAWLLTGESRYAGIAREVFDYVLAYMTDPAGGFYAAEDADSEGREGVFYVWTPEQIRQTLSPEDADLVMRYYNVTAQGNFEGANILHVVQHLEQFAREWNRPADELRRRLDAAREQLRQARDHRPRPHRDEKIIVAWNGLMISALARGSAALDEPAYLDAARRCARFILDHLLLEGRLMRCYAGGRPVDKAVLDDYACLIRGLLDLYEADFDPSWLRTARALADEMSRWFADSQGSGFFLTGVDAEQLIIRVKPDYDGAIPSGNSAAAMDFFRLGHFLMDRRYSDIALGTVEAFSETLNRSATALTDMLAAVDFALGPRREIVLAGPVDDERMKRMIRAVRVHWLPRTVVLLNAPEHADSLRDLVPAVADQTPIDGQPTAYICENFQCRQPGTDPDRFAEVLDALATHGTENENA